MFPQFGHDQNDAVVFFEAAGGALGETVGARVGASVGTVSTFCPPDDAEIVAPLQAALDSWSSLEVDCCCRVVFLSLLCPVAVDLEPFGLTILTGDCLSPESCGLTTRTGDRAGLEAFGLETRAGESSTTMTLLCSLTNALNAGDGCELNARGKTSRDTKGGMSLCAGVIGALTPDGSLSITTVVSREESCAAWPPDADR